jgi:hypothetical protein
MANGKWQMANGKWQMANDEWRDLYIIFFKIYNIYK